MNIMNYTYTDFQNPLSANFDRGMTNGPNPLTAGSDTCFGFASFLLGTGSGGYEVDADAVFIKKDYGWYFQGAWKVSPKLTANTRPSV